MRAAARSRTARRLAEIVITTHRATEDQMARALASFETLDVVKTSRASSGCRGSRWQSRAAWRERASTADADRPRLHRVRAELLRRRAALHLRVRRAARRVPRPRRAPRRGQPRAVRPPARRAQRCRTRAASGASPRSSTPRALDRAVSGPEGNTNLYESERLARWAASSRCSLKHEGENPTGSFKDRGHDGRGHARAWRSARRRVACASTGNTSASMASYAARGGPAGDRLHPAGRGRARQAQPVDRLRRADGPDQGRFRRRDAARRRADPRPGDLPAELAQPVPARRAEDDRPRDAPAARLGDARLDRRCPAATSATRAPSARRSTRRRRSG